MDDRTKGTPLGNPKASSILAPPRFNTVEAERKDRKLRLAAVFRLFVHFGYDEGLAGHITVRDPEHIGQFWVNPLGVHFAHMTPADLVLVSHEGKVIQGDQPVNASAFAIHSSIHKARPDVIAAAHAHSIHGKTGSVFGRLLDPITQGACAFYEDHAVFDHYTGVFNETSEGEQIARALGAKKAAILKNHGLLTVGKSVDIAAWFLFRWTVAAGRSFWRNGRVSRQRSRMRWRCGPVTLLPPILRLGPVSSRCSKSSREKIPICWLEPSSHMIAGAVGGNFGW